MKSKKINSEIFWGGSILSIYIVWAVCWAVYGYFVKGTFSSPYIPLGNIENELIEPSLRGDFILGTDVYGRSIFEIISSGLSYSLSVSLLVSSASAAIGIILGYLSVVGPKTLKHICDLTINLIFIFPSILIAIMVMSVTGQSYGGLFFALVITGWPSYARIARGETKRVLGLSYVESSRAVGIGELGLFFSIIIPAILPFLLIHIVLGISGVIISEATLGFLGLGGSEYSWGSMLAMAKSVLLEAPYVAISISVVMSGLIIGLNLLGDGLRDYLDPKVKN